MRIYVFVARVEAVRAVGAMNRPVHFAGHLTRFDPGSLHVRKPAQAGFSQSLLELQPDYRLRRCLPRLPVDSSDVLASEDPTAVRAVAVHDPDVREAGAD